MILPTIEECYELLDEYEVPQRIKDHTEKVRKVALIIGEKLIESGIMVNMELIEKAAILHDLDKLQTLHDLKEPELITHDIIIEKGFPPELAETIKYRW